MNDLLIKINFITLRPPIMLPQHKTMIRIHDQHRIFPQIILIHLIQNLPQIPITHLAAPHTYYAHAAH